MLRIIWEYFKTAKSSAVDDYATLDCLVLVYGEEEAFIHKWDETMHELGFTPETRSLKMMWIRNMNRSTLMNKEMEKYDDASSDDSIRQYPKLR